METSDVGVASFSDSMRSDTNPRSPACNSKDEPGMTKKLPPANQIESAPRVKLAVASRWLMTGASHIFWRLAFIRRHKKNRSLSPSSSHRMQIRSSSSCAK